MALWDKLRTELDRAGRVAQDALDEGKLRLDVFRARQLTDKAAQALGYAVYRSRTGLEAADDAALTRLVEAVTEREAEVARLEARLKAAKSAAEEGSGAPQGDGGADAAGSGETPASNAPHDPATPRETGRDAPRDGASPHRASGI